MKLPSFVGGSYVSTSPTANSARTVNFYVELMEVQGGRAKAMLYPTPGVITYISTAGIGGRGSFAMDGRAFAVIGTTLNEITDVATSLGAVIADANPATLNSNGDGGGELFLTSGDVGYILDLVTNALTIERPTGNLVGAMLDGYFLVLDPTDSTVYISEHLDGKTWDPTQRAQRSLAPDRWVAMATNYREVWLFGTETSEVWFNAGTSPFPFAPHPSGLVPYGIAAPFSVKNVNGTLMWLAQTKSGCGQVVVAQGFTPRVISTQALTQAIEKYGDVSDAIGDTFDCAGHTFYLLTFPSAGNISWLYDLNSKVWTELVTWISEDNTYIAWRPLFHFFFDEKHLMLDRTSGNILHLSPAFGLDVDGRPIRRMRVAPIPMADLKRMFMRRFTLFLENGLGLTTGQGSQPEVAMRKSNDGAKTWGTERKRNAGPKGEYRKRVDWFNLGAARDPWVEVVMTDPIPWRLVDAFMDADVGTT